MIGYRTVMRIAHRWDWHYAPVIGPLEPGDGNDFQRWCHWCGFRQDFRRVRGSNKRQAFVILEADPRHPRDRRGIVSFDENQPRAEFLAGPDEDGIDHLWNEIESLDIWREAANDPNYDIQRVNLTWRETAAHLAERGAFLGRLLVVTRDTLREHGLFASTPETGEAK